MSRVFLKMRETPGRDTVVCQECSLSLAEKRKFYVAASQTDCDSQLKVQRAKQLKQIKI